MESYTEYSGWRPLRYARPTRPMTWPLPEGFEIPEIPATRFFDNISYIGDEWVGCFAVETGDGFFLIDCLEPTEKYLDMIERGAAALGLDCRDMRAVLITHGHGDHWGCAGALLRKYGAEPYMSRADYEYARAGDPALPFPKLDFEVKHFLGDGDIFTLGDTSVRVFETPGHTRGCLSFMVQARDEGREHQAALWGGTGIPRAAEDRELYLASAERFLKACGDMKVDAEIATHPFVDCSKERLRVCREIVNGVANPFVIGNEAALRYQRSFYDFCAAAMKK